jgi:ADP-ribosylglycohydrolase
MGVEGMSGKIVLNLDEYRDKVLGCWLGKNIGGTLGAPFEGRRETHDLKYYVNVTGEPTPNDDLDLQLLWLKALEERGPRMESRILGEYWLSYVPVDWNEYGIGKANMRKGISPPLSGEYRNVWKHSNGAWIRSEIWACIAPGCPEIAIRYAYEDACVDHGSGEGTLAELFTASIESAAFVLKDRDELIDVGLSMIPEDCGVARAVRTAIDSYRRGLSWLEAREAVIKETEDTGWFMAPRNIGFVIIGWLYGDGDFGKSICTAVNCGDDTDCTGATLGSILGIINGASGIPKEWKDPIGDTIKTVAIANFEPPKNIMELTERTISMARKVLLEHGEPVIISREPTDLSSLSTDMLKRKDVARELWERSPFVLQYEFVNISVSLDYTGYPEISAGSPRKIELKLRNKTPEALEVELTPILPPDWGSIPPEITVGLEPAGKERDSAVEHMEFLPGELKKDVAYRGMIGVMVKGRPTTGSIPIAFIGV